LISNSPGQVPRTPIQITLNHLELFWDSQAVESPIWWSGGFQVASGDRCGPAVGSPRNGEIDTVLANPEQLDLGIVATIVIHRGAQDDLELVWNSDEEAAAAIETLLQEAKGNQAVLDTFTVQDFFTFQDFGADSTQPYHIVRRWTAQQRVGRNLWRLKIWDLEDHLIRHRIVYAFEPRVHRYFVLGVFDRNFNYAESDPRTQRILAVYDNLDIPSYR
jgi:hypothetical protein